MRRLFHFARSRPVLAALFTCASIALLKGLYDLTSELSVNLAIELQPDAKIYMAAGRMLLNGLHPYAELFENKPPLIFLLAAFSQGVTGNQTLASVAQVATFIALPVTWVLGARTIARDCPAPWRRLWTGVALLFGLAFTEYAAMQAGFIEPESFGAVFGFAYLLLLFVSLQKITRRRVALLTLFFFLCVWTKEPFAAVLLIGALLIAPSVKAFVRGFLLPAVFAGVAGVGMLLLLGDFGSYVTVYLPFMLLNHVEERGSPLVRTLDFPRFLGNLWHFSWFLCALTVLLFALLLWSRFRRWRRGGSIVPFLFALVAPFVLSFVVGLGGQYYPHHFIFALPVLMLFPLFWMREACDNDTHMRSPATLGVIALLVLHLLLFYSPRIPLWRDFVWHGEREVRQYEIAAQFDAMLSSCKVERYLPYGWELEDLWGRTAHSPYSSTFTSFRWGLTHNYMQFSQIFVEQLNEAKVIVLYPSRLDLMNAEVNGLLLKVFTKDPPPCAAQFMPIADAKGENYVVLFRR